MNSCNLSCKEKLLNEIQSLDFAVNDLSLYLDTHPNDFRALNLHNEYATKSNFLKNEYQKIYGPLTINFSSDTWQWSKNPWPWERSF